MLTLNHDDSSTQIMLTLKHDDSSTRFRSRPLSASTIWYELACFVPHFCSHVALSACTRTAAAAAVVVPFV